jgi:hypothetical protein
MPKNTFPIEWSATEKEIKNGWKNSPDLLSELAKNLESYQYVENSDDMMETIDNLLELLKKKCTIKLL